MSAEEIWRERQHFAEMRDQNANHEGKVARLVEWHWRELTALGAVYDENAPEAVQNFRIPALDNCGLNPSGEPKENTMTLTLEIPSEIEHAAAASQTDVRAFILAAASEKAAALSPQQKRRAAVEAVSGCLKGSDWIVEDFNAEKRADIERENERDLL